MLEVSKTPWSMGIAIATFEGKLIGECVDWASKNFVARVRCPNVVIISRHAERRGAALASIAGNKGGNPKANGS